MDVHKQAHDLKSTADELGSLLATIREIAANADRVSGEANDTVEAAEMRMGTATTIVEVIENAEQSVDELASLVGSLDDRMDDVSKSTDLIGSIAEQTSTLALNTNIEATHASDGDEGFAVVADEARSLVDETQNHSVIIERTITGTIKDVARVQAEVKQTRA